MKKNYKLKIVCMLCVLTAALGSCKKNEVMQDHALSNNYNVLAYAGDKEYDVLGYGYDVTGRVANSESSRLQIIDIRKYAINNPGLYLPNDHVQEYFEYSFGENAESYSNKLTQKYKATLDLGLLKKIRFFKGEINASFAKKDSASSKYVYATIRKMIKQKSMKIFYSIEDIMKNYLTTQFKADLIALPAATLVQRYGTHVLTDIELGGRLDMNYEAQTNNVKREDAATAGANITAWKILTVNADIATNNVEASSNFNQTLYYNTVGGDGTKSLIGELSLDNTPIKINIANWQSSCTKDNAALIKIGDEGLIPIEELIADEGKKAEVKAYIEFYCRVNEVKLLPTELYEFYNGVKGRHAYTLNPNMSASNFYRNAEPFKVYPTAVNGAVPLYQFYNPNFDNRVLTTNRNPGFANYNYDGINCYVYKTQVAGTVPIYEFYNPSGGHLYSTDRNVPSRFAGWNYNGVPFYAFPN